MTVGIRIQSLRASKGMTQDEFAGMLGITRSAIAQWETDRAVPAAQKMQKIEKILGSTANYILTGEVGDLTKQETGLIESFRACGLTDRFVIFELADRLSKSPRI